MKYWLLFWKDNGNREDCSVFYSELVYAKTKKDALDIMAKKNSTTKKEYDYFIKRHDAIKLKLNVRDLNDEFRYSGDESKNSDDESKNSDDEK